ncbi:MAG: hypothetical protein ABII90_14135 [Bacteroidota bacterium]
MQKALTTIFLMIFFTGYSSAQVKGGKFEKLYQQFEKKEYEDCLYRAENLTLKEKTKNEPEPYLYMSMCFHELARIPEQQEYYKNAFSYALKQAAKCMKKDKDSSYFNNNKDYYIKLEKWGVEKAREYYDLEKFSKAASTYKEILKIFQDDENIRFMKGVCDLLAKNTSEGILNINEAMKNINSNYKTDPVSEHLLIDGLIIYSDYLIQNELPDSAKTMISIAKNLFPENEDIINQRKKLNSE